MKRWGWLKERKSFGLGRSQLLEGWEKRGGREGLKIEKRTRLPKIGNSIVGGKKKLESRGERDLKEGGTLKKV